MIEDSLISIEVVQRISKKQIKIVFTESCQFICVEVCFEKIINLLVYIQWNLVAFDVAKGGGNDSVVIDL